MKMRYYLKGEEKVYTLKESMDNVKTKDAHYKYIKIRDVKVSESSAQSPV